MNRELDSHFQLTFTLHYRNNNLIFEQNRVTKRQLVTLKLISYLHYDLGWSYRKITKKMNGWGIKTHTGKKWGETGNSVYSVLKRFKERDDRQELRYKNYDTEITDLKVEVLKSSPFI